MKIGKKGDGRLWNLFGGVGVASMLYNIGTYGKKHTKR
jgi:hypothetical protein